MVQDDGVARALGLMNAGVCFAGRCDTIVVTLNPIKLQTRYCYGYLKLINAPNLKLYKCSVFM